MASKTPGRGDSQHYQQYQKSQPTPKATLNDVPVGKFVSDQQRRIIAAKNEIADPEAQFLYVLDQIHLLDKYMPNDSEKKAPLVKSLVGWALQEFNAVPGLKTDPRMLPLWHLLGRYSLELKMEGVMEKLYTLGFFKRLPAFYLLWAEHYAATAMEEEANAASEIENAEKASYHLEKSKEQRKKFDRVMAQCERNCSEAMGGSWSCHAEFEPLLIKYFNYRPPSKSAARTKLGGGGGGGEEEGCNEKFVENTVALIDIFTTSSSAKRGQETTFVKEPAVVASNRLAPTKLPGAKWQSGLPTAPPLAAAQRSEDKFVARRATDPQPAAANAMMGMPQQQQRGNSVFISSASALHHQTKESSMSIFSDYQQRFGNEITSNTYSTTLMNSEMGGTICGGGGGGGGDMEIQEGMEQVRAGIGGGEGYDHPQARMQQFQQIQGQQPPAAIHRRVSSSPFSMASSHQLTRLSEVSQESRSISTTLVENNNNDGSATTTKTTSQSTALGGIQQLQPIANNKPAPFKPHSNQPPLREPLKPAAAAAQLQAKQPTPAPPSGPTPTHYASSAERGQRSSSGSGNSNNHMVQSSFTAQLYKNAIDVFANTLPYVGGGDGTAVAAATPTEEQSRMMGGMAPRGVESSMAMLIMGEGGNHQSSAINRLGSGGPKEDFSVFCDQPSTLAPSGGGITPREQPQRTTPSALLQLGRPLQVEIPLTNTHQQEDGGGGEAIMGAKKRGYEPVLPTMSPMHHPRAPAAAGEGLLKKSAASSVNNGSSGFSNNSNAQPTPLSTNYYPQGPMPAAAVHCWKESPLAKKGRSGSGGGGGGGEMIMGTRREQFSFNEDSLLASEKGGSPSEIAADAEMAAEFAAIATPPNPRPASSTTTTSTHHQQQAASFPTTQTSLHGSSKPPVASQGPPRSYAAGDFGEEPSLASTTLRWDEMTVSGAHGKFALSQATSTPCRGGGPAPVLNLQSPIDDPLLGFGSLTEAEREEILQRNRVCLFGGDAADDDDAAVGGTALQRRLSLGKPALELLQQHQVMQVQRQPQKIRSIRDKRPTVASITHATGSLSLNSAPQQQQEGGGMEASERGGANPNFGRTPAGGTGEAVLKLHEENKENNLPASCEGGKVGADAPLVASVSPAASEKPICGLVVEEAEKGGVQPLSPEAAKSPAVLNESTHHHRTMESIRPGTINPWNDDDRRRVLANAPIMVECHLFVEERCPRLDVGKRVELGGETFHLEKLLGEGGFAKVFLAKSTEDGKTCAIKYEVPACPWEVYICSTLKRRLAPPLIPFVMEIRDAYIFSNASTITYDYHPYGTLLELSNAYKRDSMEMGGLLVTFFAIQLGRVLEHVHALGIIHGDVKPDNLMIIATQLPERAPLEELLATPAIKLIDWGRAIDMNHFKGVEFLGKAGTDCFDCVEMISNRPWNYQTDYYGFVATAHVLMHNDYMITYRKQENAPVRPVKQIKRRFALREMWLDIFDQFLNIPDCQSLPSWSFFNEFMQKQLRVATTQTPDMGVEWRKAIERYNSMLRNAVRGAAASAAVSQ